MAQLKNAETLTQEKLILQILEKGQKLTPLDALEPPLRCMRLASRISSLKKEGHPIVKEMVTVPSGKRVACYSLIKQTA